MEPRPLTVGTAGHVDHGKTALVKALTGRDTDRLAEEKRRGVSIELGFAELDLGERRLSLVDVPGHERFVRTMIAGASGVDLFLMVVAADDGVMPQTVEHLAVLRALGVEQGVVALSKCDLADGQARLLAAEQCAELLPGAPLVEVSARSGAGLAELRGALARSAAAAEPETPQRSATRAPVLHVDRAFSLPGHGTVVTGTLWSGTLSRGQQVMLLPQGKEARIRAIEVHDRRREEAAPRQRVAVNLVGVGRDEVARGDVLTTAKTDVRPTYRLDVDLGEAAAAVSGERRVQAHLGTREAPARVVALGDGQVQLRLEQPLLARRGDRVVVRRIAPPDTLGGGVILHPSSRRHGPGAPAKPQEERRDGPGEGKKARQPPVRGQAVAAAPPGPLAMRLLERLRAAGDRPPTPAALAEAEGVERRAVEGALGELVAGGAAVRVKPEVVYPAATYERLAEAIVARAEERGSTSIAEVRDQLGLSRKYAQALLEHLDGAKLLRRRGDRHIPRPAPRA